MMSQSKHEDLSKLLEKIVCQAKDHYLYGSDKPPVVESVPTIRVLFKEIYDCHKKDKYFWEYCHIDVYKDTFKSRFATYKSEHDDVPDILDFVNSELEYLDNLLKYDIDGLDDVPGYDSSNSDDKQISLRGFSLVCLFGKDDPTFLKTIIMSNTHKFKLLNNIKDMKSDKERMDSLDILLATKKRIRTIDPLDEPSKLRLIEHGVLKEEQDGTFKYIDDFYDHIYTEAKNYIEAQSYFLSSSMWDNNFINFDSLPIKTRIKLLEAEIESQYSTVNHPLAIDPDSEIDNALFHLLNYKNVLYIHLEVHQLEGLEDFKSIISFQANKLYFDNLINKLKSIEVENFPVIIQNNASTSLISLEKTQEIVKPFHEYLNHPNNDLLAFNLKKALADEKGKSIFLMLKVLEEFEPKILYRTPGDGTKLYNALVDFFGNHIGSKPAVIQYKYEEMTHRIDYDKIKVLVQSCIPIPPK